MSKKKQIKQGWKAVSVGPSRSSVWALGIANMEYPVGETVHMDPDLGPLFVFDNLIDAEFFRDSLSYVMVVPCDYVPTKLTVDHQATSWFCTKEDFVANKDSAEGSRKANWPSGTVFAESVTCLE